GVRVFCQVCGERDCRYVSQPKESFHRASPYLQAGITRESPQQWMVLANAQSPKTRGCHCAHTCAFVSQGMGQWPDATCLSKVSQCPGGECTNRRFRVVHGSAQDR